MRSIVANAWAALVKIVLAEWMLTFRSRRPNSGGIVIARALWTSTIVYVILVSAKSALEPESTFTFSTVEARKVISGTLTWYGALFGAAYASLYNRFSSQWTYLAQLYNQIKASSVSNADKEASRIPLAEWKAGFIEDADDLHLSSKPSFAGTIRSWGKEEHVRTAFARDTIGGLKRLDDIIARAEHYYGLHKRDLPEEEQNVPLPQ